ncbi:hypothetical protein SCMC78_43590 [Streptomyces sp. CMC78]|uniref:Uncharacterized protein n=1 Tax=Streptomyces sp. CMC78 TaxID=3231512 RepID=A0AB33KFA8_9ACTN
MGRDEEKDRGEDGVMAPPGISADERTEKGSPDRFDRPNSPHFPRSEQIPLRPVDGLRTVDNSVT